MPLMRAASGAAGTTDGKTIVLWLRASHGGQSNVAQESCTRPLRGRAHDLPAHL